MTTSHTAMNGATGGNGKPMRRFFRTVRRVAGPHPLLSAMALAAGLAATGETAHYVFAVFGGFGEADAGWGPYGFPRNVALLCALAAASAWNVVRPRYGGYAVMAIVAVMTVTAFPVPLTVFLLAFAATASLTFLDPISGCAGGIAFSSLMIVYGRLEPYGIMGYGSAYTLGACVAVSAVIGYCGHAIVRTVAERRRRDELARGMRLARELHDHVTNDLNDIVMLIDGQLADTGEPTDGPTDESAERYRTIRNLAIDALRHTRRTITTLDGRTHAPETPKPPAAAPAMAAPPVPSPAAGGLSETIERQRLRLERIGHSGEIIVIGDAKLPPASACAFIADFLRELFGNIAKHADPQQGYTMFISFSPTDCTIELCDHPKRSGPSEEGLRSGLTRYRALIEQADGALTVTDGDEWTMHARIPYRIAGTR